MSDNDLQIKAQAARQLAYETLKADKKYEFSAIPQSVLDAEMNKYMSLSLEELQGRLSGLNSKKPSDGWESMGLHLSDSQKAEAESNMTEQAKILDANLKDKPVPKKSYTKLKEQAYNAAEQRKLSKMTEAERKEYIMSKFMTAKGQKDMAGMFNALGEFYGYECEFLDKKFGITGTKEFLKKYSGLNALVDYLDKAIDDGNTDNLSAGEFCWNAIKGVGDTLDSLIGTQGLTMGGVLGGSMKAAALIPKAGTAIGGAIQAYFAIDGTVMAAEGVAKLSNAETGDEVREASGQTVMGAAMAAGGVRTALNSGPQVIDNGLKYTRTPFGNKDFKLTRGDYKKLTINENSASKLKNPNPTNLTNELERVPYSASQVRSLLAKNPALNRTVGSLPQKWGKKVGANGGFNKIDEAFSNFAKDFSSGNCTDATIQNLQSQLSSILGTDAKVKFLGQGMLGSTYTITVDGQKYVLKTFYGKTRIVDLEAKGHGNYPELTSAVYANKHDKGHFAKFYMGKFGENNDGYILTKFVEKKDYVPPTANGMRYDDYRNFSFNKFTKNRMISHDNKSENIYGKTILDYGTSHVSVSDKLSAKGLTISRLIADALDNNSMTDLNNIIKQYGSAKEFPEVQRYFKTLINDNCNVDNFQVLYAKRNMLQKLGLDYKPDIKYLLSEGLGGIMTAYRYSKMYGMTDAQLAKLQADYDKHVAK